MSGAVGGAFFAASSPVLAQASLRAPSGPMRLARTLVRGLSDGQQIVVERAWSVDFSRQGGGLAINGRQIFVDVRAPERIAQIAQIERSRVTDGQFPILIGSDGQIVASGETEHAADLERAIDLAGQMIADAGTPVSHQRRLKMYMGQIQASSSSLLDRQPRDLFFPQSTGFTERRPVNLPTGEVGEFLVEYTARAQPTNGLLDQADRRIVTRIGGSEQTSSEHWELRAI